MTFIEQIFGLSLDNGSGSLELLVLLVPITAFVAIQIRSRFRIRRDARY